VGELEYEIDGVMIFMMYDVLLYLVAEIGNILPPAAGRRIWYWQPMVRAFSMVEGVTSKI
jgi:hypothetical protein